MSLLQSLAITDFRNLKSVSLSPSPAINVFYGANGSGKTSLLEAICFLGLARSFRSTKVKPYIRYTQPACTVFGRLKDNDGSVKLGVSRAQDSSCRISVNGELTRQLSSLASLLPVQVINSDTFRLLEGSPKDRRQFLDWGVFHVEHQFLGAWKRYQKAMKQRNALLRRDKMDSSLLAVWDAELSQSGEEIDNYRSAYFERFKPFFEEALACLSGVEGLQLSYQRGWDKDTSLLDVLSRSAERDFSVGHTQWGPHRADIRFRINGVSAVDNLSRGQQKVVISALKLAQGKLFSTHTQHGCVYLIDDLPSELDADHRVRLCKMLEEMSAQVFITCVEKDSIGSLWDRETNVKMFYVEHGTLQEDADESLPSVKIAGIT